MSGKFRKLQKVLKGFIRFKDVLKAIKFVSGASLAGLRKELNSRYEAIQSIIPFFNNEYYSDDYNNALIVCITEDRGCCGPHNNNIIDFTKTLVSFLEENDIFLKIYCIGLKGAENLRKSHMKYLLGALVDYQDIRFNIDLSYLILTSIFKISSIIFDRYFFVFNRYISTQIQKVLAYEISSYNEFLITLFNRVNEKNKISGYFGVLLNKSNLFLEDIYQFSISLLLSDCLSDNKYSFLASRFFAMENAIQNVEELIESLTILYNKARQESITTELTEIITCKEAIS
jgi:F-type H+-transporting ATPase subunit gamma